MLLALLEVLQQFVFELAIGRTELLLNLWATFVEKELVMVGFLRSDKGCVVFFELDWWFGGTGYKEYVGRFFVVFVLDIYHICYKDYKISCLALVTPGQLKEPPLII
jgi:hypothetical protein